ncbi:MAG: hypothetical protein CMM32_01825 [Rhodospirillaceae bacterium]|nr:hypothetical protein [Rhodospirillaceae bacterium]
MRFGSTSGEVAVPERRRYRSPLGVGCGRFGRLAGLFRLAIWSFILCVVAGEFWPAKAVAANGFGEEQELRIRSVIGAQLEAFRAGDADKAFSYAAPAIRAKFETPSKFLSMVQKYYPAVYSSRTSEFVKLTEIEGIWIQGVIISDEQGGAWFAQYPMELQSDGRWLINGCIVTALGDQAL